MPDYGKISWQSTKCADIQTASCGASNEVDAVLELCKKLIPHKIILKSDTAIVEERAALHEAHKKIIEKIVQHPFLVAFLVWVKEIASLHQDMVHTSKILLEHGFIGVLDKKNKVWTIADARGFDHRIVIDAVRCQHELPLPTREQLVTAYLAFIQWLAQETYGYINKLDDPDVVRTQGRLLAYPLFISFLTALKDKERLVAKLLYFGGSRTLEEILNLQLEAVDFEKKIIHYPSQVVHYPAHIFADIQVMAAKRKQGRVFLGRQNAPLSPPTIFRNFKEAALEVGLGQSFSPAILTSGSQ